MILVAGGTGRLGTLVTRRLLDRGLPVRVLTRDPAGPSSVPSGVEVAVGDVRDPASLTAAVAGVDVVVSAFHGFAGSGGGSPATVDRDGNAHLIDAAATAGADVVMMSVVGASSDNPMELFRMKYAAEQYLWHSGVSATVVQATAFAEMWVELLRQTAGRSGRPLVFGRGDNPINFVCVDVVAAAVERAVTDPSTRGTTMQIGGLENLTFDQLAALVQARAGHSGSPRHIPPPVLRLLASTVGELRPVIGRQMRAALAMDRIDLTFDPAVTQRSCPGLPTTAASSCLGI